jgi:hypothetical protein
MYSPRRPVATTSALRWLCWVEIRHRQMKISAEGEGDELGGKLAVEGPERLAPLLVAC